MACTCNTYAEETQSFYESFVTWSDVGDSSDINRVRRTPTFVWSETKSNNPLSMW